MADIELVIKISKEKYDVLKSDLYNTFPAEMKEWGLEAIRNGTPLPKGHGDLIDKKELLKQPMDIANYPSNYVRIAPTIIEADKG